LLQNIHKTPFTLLQNIHKTPFTLLQNIHKTPFTLLQNIRKTPFYLVTKAIQLGFERDIFKIDICLGIFVIFDSKSILIKYNENSQY